MHSQEFSAIVDQRCNLIKKVLAAKGEEYARGDSFSQLKEVAAMSDLTPEQALWVALSKHLVSVRTLIKDFATGSTKNQPQRPIIQEKIGDAINYLIILEGLFEERLSGKP